MIPEKYAWTRHSRFKMRQYRLTEPRIKRIIRYPVRVEKGIVPGAIAVMSPAGGKRYSEIWAMYVLIKAKGKMAYSAEAASAMQAGQKAKQIRIITAWRYPGKSPARDPIPQEILDEARKLV